MAHKIGIPGLPQSAGFAGHVTGARGRLSAVAKPDGSELRPTRLENPFARPSPAAHRCGEHCCAHQQLVPRVGPGRHGNLSVSSVFRRLAKRTREKATRPYSAPRAETDANAGV